jgi:lysophospholipase L1-like esterase
MTGAIGRRGAAAALAGVLSFIAAVAAAQPPPQGRFEAEVAAYEASDRSSPPPPDGVVFVGSSSIKLWDLAASFPGLAAINRGLIGSHLSDAVRYASRLVTAYSPRIVVLYAGDNDIDAGATSEQVAVQFEQFVRAVRARAPGVRIVFIGIKPSLQRWDVIERIRLANALIRAYATRDDGVAYVDVDQAMLGWDEQPRPELFASDGLHLAPEGYRLWTTLLAPLLAAPDASR